MLDKLVCGILLCHYFCLAFRWCTSSPSLSINDDFAPTSVRENEAYNWLTSEPWPQVLLTRYTDLPSTLQASNKSFFSDSLEFDSSNSFSGNFKICMVFT